MNREALRICEAVREAGGRAMLVGGLVRDRLIDGESKDFNIESKDLDIEVYGLGSDRLRALLETIAPVNTVGEHFSVYKLVFYSSNDKLQIKERFEIDVSIPRRESKSGRGHRGFVIEGDPTMTFEEAARRRDFTINALLYDPLADEIIDPFGGIRDIKRRIIRAVAADTFVEDSLRVLRAVQLAARFDMKVDAQTVELCRSIDLSDLPRERIWGEVEKLLLLSKRPSIGLQTALELNVLDKLFPEIGALESDLFTLTKLRLDEAVKLASELSKEKRVTVLLAALCYDLGKPHTATARDEAGDAPARAVLNKLGLYTLAGYDVRSQVLALVREQQRPEQFYDGREQVVDGDFRRLAQRVDIDLLYRVARADALARKPGSPTIKQDWFIEKARALGVEHNAPEALLKGRHLIEAGFTPGPQMGETLRRVYELQLDGRVNTLEEALAAAHAEN